jgi:hypothetical protein
MHRKMMSDRSYLILKKIISLPAQIANNLIQYGSHAEPFDKLRTSRFVLFKEKPSAFPVGGFCVYKPYVIASGAESPRNNLPVTGDRFAKIARHDI